MYFELLPNDGGSVHDEHLVVGVDLQRPHERRVRHVRQKVEDVLNQTNC